MFDWLPSMLVSALAWPGLIDTTCRLLLNLAHIDASRLSSVLMRSDVWPTLVEVLDRDSIACRASHAYSQLVLGDGDDRAAIAERAYQTRSRTVWRFSRDQWMATNAVALADAQTALSRLLLNLLRCDSALLEFVLHCTPLLATILSTFAAVSAPATLYDGFPLPREQYANAHATVLGCTLGFTGWFGWRNILAATCDARAAAAELLSTLVAGQSTEFRVEVMLYRRCPLASGSAETSQQQPLIAQLTELLSDELPR